ncbi:MAG TPA: proline--tRNA ligase, partial [Alphaproteobacteria bacterium]|nr:proline--tRNA ligase [Alphaproteobacteria bacterium]
NLKSGDAECDAVSENLYNELNAANITTLLDDTNDGAGAKFANADLIGIPYQVTIGPRGVKEGKAEIKNRKSGEKQEIAITEVAGFLINMTYVR